MDGIALFRHVVAGGFDAGSGVRAHDEELGQPLRLDKGGKVLAGQGIALALGEDMLGDDLQLRHQLRAARPRLLVLADRLLCWMYTTVIHCVCAQSMASLTVSMISL